MHRRRLNLKIEFKRRINLDPKVTDTDLTETKKIVKQKTEGTSLMIADSKRKCLELENQCTK